jgi:hypothetical protein
MTDKDLQRLVVKWQKRLRLMDWDINASFDDDDTLAELGAWGACDPQGFLRTATMIFRRPEEAKKKQTAFDLEVIIVHEILHIFFAPLKNENHAELTAEEQMIHTLAILLVSLERQGKKAGRATTFDKPETMIIKGQHSCASHSVKKERYGKKVDKIGYRAIRISKSQA